MKLAVIDIGSNAIRLQIVKVYDSENIVSFKKLEFMRFPLRLGKDVFQHGNIGEKSILKFEKLMKAFKLLIDLYEVKGYKAVATSAMREATNGHEVAGQIKKNTGLEIEIISGDKEADVLKKAIIPTLTEGYFIHIDVGGGSTELNLFEGKRLKKSISFRIGSVRNLNADSRSQVFQKIGRWIEASEMDPAKRVSAIGTGGNINKLFKLARHADNTFLSLTELKALRAYVKEFSYEQRLDLLKMNSDRADVIVPAAEIYIQVMEKTGADLIQVPRVGLKDGLVYELFEELSNKSLTEVEFIGEF